MVFEVEGRKEVAQSVREAKTGSGQRLLSVAPPEASGQG